MSGTTKQKGAEQGEGTGKKKQRPFWKELPILAVIALVLAVAIRTFLIQTFWIPSESMENTLIPHDRVLVNKLVYHIRSIHRGDVIVFSGNGSWGNDPNEIPAPPANPVSRVLHDAAVWTGLASENTDYIKRVIGLPGDTVSCAGPGSPIDVNGRALDERSYLYVDPQTHLQDAPSETAFFKVPPGRLFVMGDHRSDSGDSRYHSTDPGEGTIPQNEVVGRAFVVVWPFDHWKTLPIPATFRQNFSAAALPAAPLLLSFARAVWPLCVDRYTRGLSSDGASLIAVAAPRHLRNRPPG